MVYLNRIYTKTGDDGQSSLGDGTRVSKTSQRIVGYGGVDELNAILGVVLTLDIRDQFARWLTRIQNDLFDVGADLCVPESVVTNETESADCQSSRLRVTAQQAENLEQWIDAINESLTPLESFILPGGCPAAAGLHHARTVCRRVEIEVCRLAISQRINSHVVVYLNRLSDLLFVMARACNDDGKSDVTWTPGENRGTT